jgi:predicted transcriptional regulator
MELEGLFSGTRWEILSNLSQAKLSPMELAESLKTTSANISQQLRLLELAGLVKSERTRDSDRKKPRILYTLADDYSHIVLATDKFSAKRMLPLTNYHLFMLRSFFLEDVEHHKHAGMFYWLISDRMQSIDLVAVDNSSDDLNIIVVAKREVLDSIEKDVKKSEYSKSGSRFTPLTSLDFKRKKIGESLHVLYDAGTLEEGDSEVE